MRHLITHGIYLAALLTVTFSSNTQAKEIFWQKDGMWNRTMVSPPIDTGYSSYYSEELTDPTSKGMLVCSVANGGNNSVQYNMKIYKHRGGYRSASTGPLDGFSIQSTSGSPQPSNNNTSTQEFCLIRVTSPLKSNLNKITASISWRVTSTVNGVVVSRPAISMPFE